MNDRISLRLVLSLLLLDVMRPLVVIAGGDHGVAVRSPHPGPEVADTPSVRIEGPVRVPPALALAEVYVPGIALDRYLVSEKLDGVRGYWDGQRLLTRGGHVIQAPSWFTADFPALPLDGELWMGRGTFERLSGTVRRLEPDAVAWQAVRFMVFDLPAHPGDFETRLALLRGLVQANPNPALGLVEQMKVSDHTALMEMLDQVVAAGGEGLMLHRRDAVYRAGRSADRLKVKPYLEGDARVIAHLPGRGRHVGRMGSLLVEESDGTRFQLGTGFTDAQRDAPPLIGEVVTFKFHGRTVHGKPRFASFLGVVETF
ncbi:DNA ligase [Thiocapsa imhoffii]|uniref:DNA ligase n=1 Tax=Thiocapsa imhoffii TaxID=382777 RepID=A0A9X0WFJ1_9GAMM|nr:DNA ligase [Thiocapsa imhoffii]MBK1643771.1 DNA ligase [Thiocapsa imhoffii]